MQLWDLINRLKTSFFEWFFWSWVTAIPAMGRGTAEWLTYGEYRTLDFSSFNFDRIELGKPIIETAII